MLASFPVNSEHSLINFARILDEPNTNKVNLMVAGNYDIVSVFNVARPSEPAVLEIESRTHINHFSFDSKRDRVLFAHDSEVVTVYDLRTGKQCHELRGHRGFCFGSDWHSNDY